MRLPIDTTTLSLIAGSEPRPVLDMEGRPRADRATGEVLYAVDVVALGGDDGAEVWPIRIAGEPKGIRQGQPIRVSGLTAAPWEMENRHGITFRASAIEPMAPPKAAAA
jgi:hypothetical protein